jgi:SAM-dependent methyltransferase
MNQSQEDHRWESYYQAVAGNPPRATLQRALALFAADDMPDRPRFAIDLGCGAGIDTRELLRTGWRVLAIDHNPSAIDWLRRQIAAPDLDRLETRLVDFETVELPPADLINASHSLPFCPPDHFTAFWKRIVAALPAGARFAGHFFGDRDGWATRPGITCHSAAQVQQLLAAFEVEYLEEEERQGKTAVGEPKYWHLFSIVARKSLP